jgi:hypothetical protein
MYTPRLDYIEKEMAKRKPVASDRDEDISRFV